MAAADTIFNDSQGPCTVLGFTSGLNLVVSTALEIRQAQRGEGPHRRYDTRKGLREGLGKVDVCAAETPPILTLARKVTGWMCGDNGDGRET
ncbi:hypothetical protein RUM44_001129 [Polyplax serrata]|uniref:Uncharacterized protein n=1 Tax=Polyplax serrata TaxID=468196 RepID=A0ABR1B6P9_POLSC